MHVFATVSILRSWTMRDAPPFVLVRPHHQPTPSASMTSPQISWKLSREARCYSGIEPALAPVGIAVWKFIVVASRAELLSHTWVIVPAPAGRYAGSRVPTHGARSAFAPAEPG